MNAQNKKCTGLLGLIFGHRFEPRYTTSSESKNHILEAISAIEKLANKSSLLSSEREFVTDAMHRIQQVAKEQNNNMGTYVKDICLHCGQEILYYPPTPSVPGRRLELDL